eukprot:6463555-Amphidinium_carterae.1
MTKKKLAPGGGSSSRVMKRPCGSEHVQKRPAASRLPKPCELCIGTNAGEPCLFSRSRPNCPAAVKSNRGQVRCVLCDPERLSSAVDPKQRKEKLLPCLRDIRQKNNGQYEQALARVQMHCTEDVLHTFRRKAGVDTTPRQWTELLDQRKIMTVAPSAQQQGEYEKHARDDLRRRKNKFPGVFPESEAEEQEDWKTPLAEGFENWATTNSWFMCASCQRMEPRPLEPIVFRNPDRTLPGTKKCKYCNTGVGYPCPHPEDVPIHLHSMTPEVLHALRPFEIDCGLYKRASDGYRIHTDVTRLRWGTESVETKIHALRKHNKRAAKAALKHLLESEATNSYKKFYDKHWHFIEAHGEDADKKTRRLP